MRAAPLQLPVVRLFNARTVSRYLSSLIIGIFLNEILAP